MENYSASKIFILIAFIAVFLFAPKISLAATALVINEIMYDAPGVDDKHEWIELYNAGSSEIDLTDFKFNDGSNHNLNPPPQNASRGSLLIPAAGYLILTGNASTTILDLPAYAGSIIDTVMSLNNTSAALKILNKDGTQIASASYSKELGGNGNGKTLEWDGAAFKESTAEGGTPGKENSILSPPNLPNSSDSDNSSSQAPSPPKSTFSNFSDKIFINEFMPWPSADGKEWSELINTGEQSFDLSLWQIDDEEQESAAQEIPNGTVIEPGQLLVIELNKNILNNDGDQLRLLWPDGQTVHSVTFAAAKQGQSCARFENGPPGLAGEAGLWLWTNQPTPGQENKKSVSSSQIQTEQNNQSLQTKNIPAANALAETVTEPNMTAPTQKTTLNQLTENSSPLLSPQTKSSAPGQTSIPIKAAAQETITSSNSKIFLFLAGVVVLSLLSGIGLIYFKRKRSPPLKKEDEP